MCGSISKAQRVFDDNADTKIPWHGRRLLGVQWCIQGRLRHNIDARQSNDDLHLKETKKAWWELHDAWFRVISHCVCPESMETLLDWTKIRIEKNQCGLHHIFLHRMTWTRNKGIGQNSWQIRFEIKYIKWIVNRVTYVLSQWPRIFSMIPLQANLQENILTIQIGRASCRERV